jgi:colicin import membrane protein
MCKESIKTTRPIAHHAAYKLAKHRLSDWYERPLLAQLCHMDSSTLRARSAVGYPRIEAGHVMARKLKTYQTSLGFFDLAIAAPSMKAALEAWGSKANLFNDGFAKETDEPAIVAATMAKPGVVLRRPVGSNGSFTEHAELPRDLGSNKVKGTHGRSASKSEPPPTRGVDDDRARREAVAAFATEQKRRDSERRRLEAAEESEGKRRQAIEKAETAVEEAKRAHHAKTEELAAERVALDRRSEIEEARWSKQKAKLEAALRQAEK